MPHGAWDIVGAQEMVFTTVSTIGEIFKETVSSKIVKRGILYSVSNECLALRFFFLGGNVVFMFFLSKLELYQHY